MKKKYIAPTTNSISVNVCQIVCTSLFEEGNAGESGITTADSKFSDDWDIWGTGSSDDYDDEY